MNYEKFLNIIWSRVPALQYLGSPVDQCSSGPVTSATLGFLSTTCFFATLGFSSTTCSSSALGILSKTCCAVEESSRNSGNGTLKLVKNSDIIGLELGTWKEVKPIIELGSYLLIIELTYNRKNSESTNFYLQK